MEIAVIGAVALTGMYFNANEKSTEPKEETKIKPSEVPNGFDIYNQNRLDIDDENVRLRAQSLYEKSQFPQEQNVIPNYYNQLSPLINASKFNQQIKYDSVDKMYSNLDDVYDGIFDKATKYSNTVFRKPMIEKEGSPLFEDEYRLQSKKQKPTTLTVTRPEPKLEPFKTVPDKNLLNISEKLSDNAESIRKILNNDKNKCSRPKSFTDLAKSKRLIGVKDDYRKILVDDEVAKYPQNELRDNPLKEETLPPANYAPYLSQFEPLRFDSVGLPTAPNDINRNVKAIENDIAYKGGWTPYDQNGSMTYNVVPDDQLTHNNMVPDFKIRSGYGSNDYLNEHTMNYKNELFTGNLKSSWNKKQEVRPHFTPVADMTYIYGTPVRPESEDSRYIPSLYRQGERLFDKERVTPGLNLDYNEIGTHGYQSMYRTLPKTVDELRVKTKPKTTYEGRIVDGMKGEERPIQAPVISYRPDSFKITTEDDLLPLSDVNTGPAAVESFIMKETDRSLRSIEYTGGAFSSVEAVGKNVPEYMREKYKYASKLNYTMPEPMQKYAKDETVFDPNFNSFNLQFNARSQTGPVEHYGVVGSSSSKMYSNLMDEAKPTTKEQIMTKQFNPGVTVANTMRGTVHPMDEARPTVKQTTVELQHNTAVPGSSSSQMAVYYPDIAKTTIRETTEQNVVPSNCGDNRASYANWDDIAKQTIKETTVELQEGYTQLTPIDQQLGAIPLSDIAKTTTKESTVQIPYHSFLTPINQQKPVVHYQDTAKTTTKESTVEIPYQTVITPINQETGAVHYQDIAKHTTKETTVGIPWQSSLTPIDQAKGAVHYQDRAKTTTKESTVQIPWQTSLTAVNQQKPVVHYQDDAKTTTKETTVTIPYQTVITGVDQDQGAASSFNRIPLRSTTKETTVVIPYQTTVSAVDQNQGAASSFNRTPLRSTIKETTIDTKYIGMASNDVNAKGYGYLAESPFAPNTNRQTTGQEFYIAPINGDEKPKSYSADYNAKIDDRKEMLHWYRPPTACGVDMIPMKEQVNLVLKKDDNKATDPIRGHSVNNNLDRPKMQQISFSKDNIPLNLFLDPNTLKQLDDNPFSISIV